VDLSITVSGVVPAIQVADHEFSPKGGSQGRAQPNRVLGEPYQGQTLQGMLFILAITLWTKPFRFILEATRQPSIRSPITGLARRKPFIFDRGKNSSALLGTAVAPTVTISIKFST
jgi:hypothetical protein